MDWLAIFLFLGIPLIILALYGVSIFLYVTAKRANKRAPGSFSDAVIGKRKTAVIVFSLIVGTMLVVAIGFTVLLYMAIAYM